MKKIKIRFVKRITRDKYTKQKKHDYLIQRKTLFGWKYITYSKSGGCGDSIEYNYHMAKKKELLEYVLKDYYKVGKEFVKVEQYPTIKLISF